MCRSIAEGGQRCASHTRERFNRLSRGDAGWVDAAVEYASTPEGRQRIVAAAVRESSGNRFEREAELQEIVKQGDALRAANQEARLRYLETSTNGTLVEGKPVRLVGDTAAFHPDGNVHQVFRPADRRRNSVRYVQTPEGTMWTVNKHGAVFNSVPDETLFPGSGWNILTFPDNLSSADTLVDAAFGADAGFKKCKCC